AEAHRLGIIHRDLKPANLFQVRRGSRDDFIKVVDFGISKLSELTATVARVGENEGGRGGDVEGAGDEGRLITADRVMMGSPVYMSPEQMESARDVDERTDVWALGVTLCELITGKLPFSGQSLVHVYFSIASDKPLRLLEWSPGLPRGLESAILKSLERDREKRFRSVNELARAIAAFGAHASSAYLQRTRSGAGAELSVAETIGPTASAAPVGGQTLPSASHSEAAAKPRSTHRVVWAIAAILVVPILATVRDRTEPSRSSTATAQTTVAPRPLPSTPAATSESVHASRLEPASSAAQLLAAPVTTSTAASPTAEPAPSSSHAAAEPHPKHGAAPSTAPASESAASPGPSVTALTATAPSKPDVNASATSPSS